MFDNTMLVAGMHMTDNQFVRFVTSYGFQVIHRPDEDINKSVPVVHGALICTSQISHPLRNKVADAYKKAGRPWYETRSDSTAAIKEDFERLFVEPIRKELEILDIKDRFIYLLLLFHKQNTRVHSTSTIKMFHSYFKFSEQYGSLTFAKMAEMGIIEKLQGTGSQGKYKIIGLTREQRDQLINKLGVNIPDAWLIQEKEIIQAPIVEEIKEPITPKVSEEFEQEMRDFMKGMNQKIGSQLTQMQNQINRLSHSFNPNSRKDMTNQLVQRLDELSLDEYLKVHAAIIMLTKK